MIGGIIGDIVGSIYEDGTMKSKHFPLWDDRCHFTDDTVLTVATADWLLNGGKCEDYYYSYAMEYPTCGYGTGFMRWCFNRKFRSVYHPYNSYGNGSAMRVGPIGWAYNSMEEVLKVSNDTALCTHSHEEGIKGAQTIASCIFLAKNKESKEYIKAFVKRTFGYNIDVSLKEISKSYTWNATCQHTVPEAIISFLESNDFEDGIRNAISLGGDSDTIACMTGAISEAYWGIPIEMQEKAYEYLPTEFISIIKNFEKTFGNNLLL